MAHINTQVRVALIAALNGQTRAADNVASGSVFAKRLKGDARIGVRIPDQDFLLDGFGKQIRRTLAVVIVLAVKCGPDLDGDLDAFQLEVERAIDAADDFGGVIHELLARNASANFQAGDGEFASLEMTYEVVPRSTALDQM